MLNLVSFTKFSSDSGLNLTVCVSNSSSSLSAIDFGLVEGAETFTLVWLCVKVKLSFRWRQLFHAKFEFCGRRLTIKIVASLIDVVGVHLERLLMLKLAFDDS